MVRYQDRDREHWVWLGCVELPRTHSDINPLFKYTGMIQSNFDLFRKVFRREHEFTGW